MNNKLSWNDFRVVLAINEEGTLSGAGRRLRSSHATLFRHLNNIEAQLGVRLFNRARTGYTPTLAGEELAAVAKQIEGKVQYVERRIVGQDLRPSGTVRITTLDTLLAGLLSPVFADFQRLHPDISLEVVVSNQVFNLSKREADVAIRPSISPNDALVGRKIGRLKYAVYGRKEFLPADGTTPILQDIAWLGPDEQMIYPELDAWMVANKVDARCRYRINSVLAMYAAVGNGQGLAVLPCYLGDQDSRLLRFSDLIPELEIDLWLLTHADIRNAARIRALLDFVSGAVMQKRGLLAGES